MPHPLRKLLELKIFASKPRMRFQGRAALCVPGDPPHGASLAKFGRNGRVADCCGLRYRTDMIATRSPGVEMISTARGHSLDTIMLDRSVRREGLH